MGLMTAIVQKFFGAEVDRQVADRLPAAVDRSLDTIGWRRLTGSPTRELPMMDPERAIEVAYWLWKTNPLGNWIIEVVTAFVAAKGAPYTCDNEDVQAVLDGFWQDPVNRMDIHWENFVRELGIFGEQCWPAFVAEQTGRVRLGYIDPAMIDQVFPDPENVKVKVGITIKSTDGASPARRLAIVLDEENEGFLSPAGRALRETFSDGRCFFFTVNALTNEMRGTGDLFIIADHLDGYEQFLYDSSEKYAQYNAFYYDITVDGADEKKLEEERAKYQPPKTGGAFIHNEKVKSEPVAPSMGSLDAQREARLHKNHILGSMGLPEHWFGGGGDVNRATASEMDAPSRKIIENRQEKVKNMLEVVFDFVIASARNANYLRVSDEEAKAYDIQTPEISDKDVAKLSTMLRDVSTSLVAAEGQGWIDREEAAKAFAFFLAFIGYEYEPDVQDMEPGTEDYTDPKEAA